MSSEAIVRDPPAARQNLPGEQMVIEKPQEMITPASWGPDPPQGNFCINRLTNLIGSAFKFSKTSPKRFCQFRKLFIIDHN